MRINHNLTCSLIFAFTLVAPVVSAQDSAGGQTLREQLDATNAQFSKQMPAQVITNINDAVKEVNDSGILDKVIKLGDRAPDFDLPDAAGKQVRLSSLLTRGPVILTWYRGNW